MMNALGKPGTLCWYCVNSCANGCPWFTDFTPVPGWDAVPTVVKMGVVWNKERPKPSYHVNACPLFVEGRGRLYKEETKYGTG